jgi:hypothetical protein
MTEKDIQRFELPPKPEKDDGEPRRVGFELEFSGIELRLTADTLQSALDARVVSQSAAEVELEAAGLGKFNVEIDWDFLKRKAAKNGDEQDDSDWLEFLSQAAALLVPVEIVCPPIPVSRLDELEPMVRALRQAGALGTEESLFAAYGVHINTEIPRLDAATIFDYVRAYALLQWWLVDTQTVDMARRISPYIDLYSQPYLKRILSREEATLDQVFDDYLEHNPSRNRALDLLPMLAEIDEARVRSVIDDPRIKARPAFHYRLPDCHIEREGWSLRQPWASWLTVERLAARGDDLDALARSFVDAERPLIGVNRGDWVKTMDRWLRDRGLA